MKKILSVLLIFILIFQVSIVFADSGSSTLTVEQAQNIAVTDSRQSMIDDLNIIYLESVLKKAEKDAKELRGGFLKADILNADKIKFLSPLQAQINLDAAKRKKENNIVNLKLDVYKAFTDILIINKELEKENKKMAIVLERYSIAKSKYDVGMIMDADMAAVENNLDNMKNSVANIQERLKTSYLKLKNLLNMKLDDTPLSLKGDIVLNVIKLDTMDDYIQSALQSDTTILQNTDNIKINEKNMELTSKYYTVSDPEYETVKFDLDNAMNNLESSKINTEVNIRNKYNSLLNQNDRVLLAEKYEKLCEKKLKAVKMKYDKGISSKEEYLNMQESYIDARYQKCVEVNNYNSIKAEFLYTYKEPIK